MPRSNSPLAFEMVVLGQSGGPMETELSGYVLKPYETSWTDGWVGLEGGSGMGALCTLLQQGAVNTALRKRVQLSETNTSSTIGLPPHALPHTPDITPVNSSTSTKFPTILQVEDEAHNKVTLRSLGVVTGSEEDDMPLVEEHTMLPGIEWPEDCTSPLLKAGWFFSLLACQLITHAHFDHILAMVLATGSLPPRSLPPYPPGSTPCEEHVRVQVYSQRNVLEKISTVYDGEVWPELGQWATRGIPPKDSGWGVSAGLGAVKDRLAGMVDIVKRTEGDGEAMMSDSSGSTGKARREVAREAYPLLGGIGIQYCPMPSSHRYQRLPISGISQTDPSKRIGLSALHMPVLHGDTSRGTYESSAFFISADTTSVATSSSSTPALGLEANATDSPPEGPEILFWGDVESTIDDSVDVSEADDVNIKVWREAAIRWDEGRLGAVFIECSYASDRPCHLMFGHLRPQSLYAELMRLAACVRPPSDRHTLPLEGLKVYIIHVKQPLRPISSSTERGKGKGKGKDGGGIMGLIKRELDGLECQAREEGKGLGIEFIMMRRGMRIVV